MDNKLGLQFLYRGSNICFCLQIERKPHWVKIWYINNYATSAFLKLTLYVPHTRLHKTLLIPIKSHYTLGSIVSFCNIEINYHHLRNYFVNSFIWWSLGQNGFKRNVTKTDLVTEQIPEIQQYWQEMLPSTTSWTHSERKFTIPRQSLMDNSKAGSLFRRPSCRSYLLAFSILPDGIWPDIRDVRFQVASRASMLSWM